VADVLAGFATLDVPTRVAERMVNSQGARAALETLADLRLMRRDGDGFRLPPPGLAATLLDPSGPAGRHRAPDLLAEIELEVQDADDAVAAVLGRRITHLIGHRVDNDVIGITSRLTRAAAQVADPQLRDMLTDLGERVQALGGGTYVRLYYEGLTPPQPVEVTELVGSLIGNVEWHLPPGLHIRQRAHEKCWVLANPMILEESLRNLVLNSARVLAHLGRTDPKPAIQLSVVTVAETEDRAVPVTGAAVVIEVADSGAGFPTEELERLRLVTDPAGPPWRPMVTVDGKRQGLPMTAAMLREYKGVLEIRNGSQDLDGGCVRAWLPRIADPTTT
jgi:signal transduction histidine kinase